MPPLFVVNLSQAYLCVCIPLVFIEFAIYTQTYKPIIAIFISVARHSLSGFDTLDFMIMYVV